MTNPEQPDFSENLFVQKAATPEHSQEKAEPTFKQLMKEFHSLDMSSENAYVTQAHLIRKMRKAATTTEELIRLQNQVGRDTPMGQIIQGDIEARREGDAE